jgi:peptidoglycan/LPS O-acetylase OafA/YrhL
VGTVGHLVNLRDVLGPLLYVYNWVLIAYFNTPMMMTHAWSLAVEEQFYVVWPVIMIAVLYKGIPAWRTSRYLYAVAVVATAAMALRFGLGASVVVLYHGTESHGLVMLMTGAALAFWFEHTRQGSWLYWVARWAGLPAFVVICVLVLAVDHGNRGLYFGGWLAVATVIAVVLVAALNERSLVGRVLSLRPLRWFGMISYSLYLWHLPLLVLASAIIRPLGYGSIALAAIVVPTAIGLASTSFYLVERPIVRVGRARLRAASLHSLSLPAILNCKINDPDARRHPPVA